MHEPEQVSARIPATLAEVAQELRMSRSGARKWVTRHGIAKAKLGRRKVLYDLRQVVEVRDALWEPPPGFVSRL